MVVRTEAKDLSLHLFYVWLLKAAWAPIIVVVIQQLFSRSYQTDFVMHFFGGVAMAFFLYKGIIIFGVPLGRPVPLVRYLLAFGGTCWVVIAWELGELASDRLIGTGFQASAAETMVDQFCGVLGSIAFIGFTCIVERKQNKQLG